MSDFTLKSLSAKTTPGSTDIFLISDAAGVLNKITWDSVLNNIESLQTENIQDVVGAMVSGNTETLITVSYSDIDGTLDFVVEDDLSLYDNSNSNFFDTAGTGLSSAGSTVSLDTESVQDIVGAMVSGNTETLITVTYEDTDGTIDFIVNDDLSLYDNSSSNFFDTAGNGLTSSGSTVNIVGTADRITVNADDIDIASTYIGQTSIITVGTLTTGAINWSGNITTSGDLQAGSAIIDNLSLDANRLTTTSGNLELYSAGDIIFDPTGNDLLPASNYDLNIGSESLRYLSLHAAELWVNTLVAQETISTTGGRLLITNATELISDINTSVTTITVKHNNIKPNDILYLEKSGQIEFMQATSSYSANGDNWDYTVTRNLDGTGGNNWLSGDAIVNLGQTGDGFLELYSHHSIKENILESIYNYNDEGPVWSDNFSDSNDWTFFSTDSSPDAGDIIYFGSNRKFYELQFYIKTAGVYSVTYAYEYYNGATWSALTLVDTPDFTATGIIKWTWSDPAGWSTTSINGESKYWIRLRLSAVTSFTTRPVQGYQPVYEGGQHIGPTIVGYERDSNTFNDFSTRWAIGNLNGLYGNSTNIIGVGFGEYSDDSSFITIDSTNGIRITNRISGANTIVFEADMSGVTKIGNWIVEEYVLRDTNSYIVLQSGNGGQSTADGKILIDGYNGGSAYGMISVGTGLTLSGSGTGIITGGTIQTSTGTDKIILDGANNELSFYTNSVKIFSWLPEYSPSWGSGESFMVLWDHVEGDTEFFGFYSSEDPSGVMLFGNHLFFGDHSSNWLRAYSDGITMSGKLYFDGYAPDVNLYRSSANLLKTDDDFSIGGGTINLGTDVNIYRGATNQLKTDDTFVIAGGGGTKAELQITSTTASTGILFGSDTNLYRLSANTLATDDDFMPLADLYTESWQNYSSSSVNGWAATPTKLVYYKKIGNFVFVNFFIYGTSINTSATFTLPYAAKNDSSYYIRTAIQFTNAGTASSTPGKASLDYNSSTVYCYTDWGTTGWTGSGTKTVIGQFFYESNT